MKKILLFFICFTIIFLAPNELRAQVIYDSVILQSNYSNMSFYSLSQGEQANVDNTDWDIAFPCIGFGYTVRVNTANGNELYVYPNGDNTSWATVDTTGINSWNQLYDCDTSWEFGAFSDGLNPANPYDVGWGIYNGSTHNIHGDSIFILRLKNGALKKIEIENLIGGKFKFRYANIDGSSLIDTFFDKLQYSGHQFVYYDVSSGTEINKEPLATDWDVVFTKFTTEVAPNFYYPVTGVLHNEGVEVAEASQVSNASTAVNYGAYTMDSKINTIGYDWKSFNQSTNVYNVQDSLAYFIKAKNGAIWRLVFTGFEGSSNGKILFEKEKLADPVSVGNVENNSNFALYPNPAHDVLHVLFDAQNSQNWAILLFDMQGRLITEKVIRESGFNDYQLNISNLNAGTYTLRILDNQRSIRTARLVTIK